MGNGSRFGSDNGRKHFWKHFVCCSEQCLRCQQSNAHSNVSVRYMKRILRSLAAKFWNFMKGYSWKAYFQLIPFRYLKKMPFCEWAMGHVLAQKMVGNTFESILCMFRVMLKMSAIKRTLNRDRTTHETDFKVARSKILKFYEMILMKGIFSTGFFKIP